MEKKKLLLHSCCGPCSTSVIETLKENFDLTILYYNPNIYPKEEYEKRLYNQRLFIEKSGNDIVVIDGRYDDNIFFENEFNGLENCPEGGSRCEKCIFLRLSKTAQFAKEHNFDIFTTTLSVSPHKNAKYINEIGRELSKKYNIKYLESDFKKKDGFLNSIKLSKKYELYRQNYCGCKYSLYPNLK